MNDRINKYATKPCPECGGLKWNINPGLSGLMVFNDKVNPPAIKNDLATLVTLLFCDNCGFTKTYLTDDSFQAMKKL